MSNSMKYGIVGAVVAITVLLVWLLGSKEPVNVPTSKIKHISSNWEEKYKWSSKDAYGLFIFNDLLKDHTGRDSAKAVLSGNQLDSLSANEKTGTYIFLGGEFGLYDAEIDTLLSLVEKGSDLVLISGNVTQNISESFEPPLSYTFDYNPVPKVTIGKEKYEMVYLLQNDTLAYPWKMIYHPTPYSNTTKIISKISGVPNFISFPFGKGKIMIHSTPECFFNFQLARKDGFKYAYKVLEEIDPKKKLYYLELGRIKEKEPEDIFDVFRQDKKEGKRDDSYLQFLFKTPALRAALLLAILGLGLFLIFRTKRMQPQVDVLPQKRNMSDIFVTTVASIYRNRDNPFSLLQLEKKNFYNTILKHFFIDLSRRTDHREIQHLSVRSGVSEEEISALLERLETEKAQSVSEDYLLETSKQKRQFYEKTGIISERITKRLDDRQVILYRPVWINFPLILAGIGLILAGLYLLVIANGIGIILWPLGSIILVWAFLRMSRPVIRFRSEEITFYQLIGKKKQYFVKDLMRVDKKSNGYAFYFNNGDERNISYSELGKAERNQLEIYLIKHKIIEF